MPKVCAKPNCAKTSSSFKTCQACKNILHTTCGEFSTFKDKSKGNAVVHICSTCCSEPQNICGLAPQYLSRSNSASSQSSFKRKKGESDVDSENEDEEVDLRLIYKAIKKGNKATEDLSVEVKTLNTNFSERCDVLEGKVASVSEELQALKLAHETEVNRLNTRINALEFETCTEVYIHGHLQAANENFDSTLAVVHLAEFLEVPISKDDITSTRVIPRKGPNASKFAPIISATFFSHLAALRLVEAKRKFGKLTNHDLLESDSYHPIAVSFPLSRDLYELLKVTKRRAQIHNYKYVWNQRGTIMVRKQDGARVISISTQKDLDSLMPLQQVPPTPMETNHATDV